MQGSLESTSLEAAEYSLYNAGYERILKLRAASFSIDWRKLFLGDAKASKQTLHDFTNELTILIKSGLPLVTALKQLEKQSGNTTMNTVISKLVADIQAGTPLSKALISYPGVFSETYCSMIEANEKAGTLDAGLTQIAKELKQEITTRSQVQRALMQPAIIGVMAIGVAFLLVTVVLPPLIDIFRQMGTALPLPTKILIAMSDFINGNLLPIAVAIVSFVSFALIFGRRPKGKQWIDRLVLRLPLIGNLVIWYNTARFSRTMSNLLKAGLLLPDAINVVVRSVGNTGFRNSLLDLRRQLLQGQNLGAAVSKNRVFPALLVEMINVGQVTGELDISFGIVADYFEVKMERHMAKLTSLIEPALILFLGLVVGFIAVSVISTIYGLVGGMK